MKFFISFLFGFAAEIATGLVIGAGMAITRGTAIPSVGADLPSWVPAVSMIAGPVFTFLIAWWRASRYSDNAVAHALQVARNMTNDQLLIINLSGRGDKDIDTVRQNLTTEDPEKH